MQEDFVRKDEFHMLIGDLLTGLANELDKVTSKVCQEPGAAEAVNLIAEDLRIAGTLQIGLGKTYNEAYQRR